VDEFSAYRQLHFPAGKASVYDDILTRWWDHAVQFPKLALLARIVLFIPATSASSERALSAAGNTVSEHRTRLDSETADSILSVCSNTKS
jgi:hAT family C-terminal dimerisation region